MAVLEQTMFAHIRWRAKNRTGIETRDRRNHMRGLTLGLVELVSPANVVVLQSPSSITTSPKTTNIEVIVGCCRPEVPRMYLVMLRCLTKRSADVATDTRGRGEATLEGGVELLTVVELLANVGLLIVGRLVLCLVMSDVSQILDLTTRHSPPRRSKPSELGDR